MPEPLCTVSFRPTEAIESASVSLADASDAADWDAFVRAHPDGTLYHRFAWRDIIEGAFGHPSYYLMARRGGRPCGVLPVVRVSSRLFGRYLVSVPFVDYGGVLAEDDYVARALLATADTIMREERCRWLELRHRGRHFPELAVVSHRAAMIADLPPDSDRLWQSIDRKARNQVRKAEQNGIEVHSGGIEFVDEFYRVFSRNMRDLGTPVYPRRLFVEALTRFGPDARVFLARGGAVLAAGITLAHQGVTTMPWASSLKEARPLCANVLLYWRALQDAIANGASKFDFGRSRPEGGTYHFKQQWGARSTPLAWECRLNAGQHLVDHSPDNPRFRIAITVWQHLPVGMTNLVGPRVVRGLC